MLDLSGMPNRLRNCSATVRECAGQDVLPHAPRC